MSDLNAASNADLVAALKQRTDADLAKAIPLMEQLAEILNPETSILQQGVYSGGARAVFQACSAFKTVHEQVTKAQQTAQPKT